MEFNNIASWEMEPTNTQPLEEDIKEEVYSNNTEHVNMVYLYQPVQQAPYSYLSDHSILVERIKKEDNSRNIIANLDLQQTGKQETADSYQCSQCANYFSRKDDLIIHQQIHTREQPYQCSLFEKCSAQKSKMSNHSRTTNEEKPYQCNICDKYIARKQDLVIHQKIHTGELYQCSHCKESRIC